ncbi:MAG: hypothetical protein ACKPKO_27085 [Candidatus Fonsibacter sp.]
MNREVDALVEKGPVQKEWQDEQSPVEAESVEANAQEKTERDQVVGDYDNNAGSSGSAKASTTTTWQNQERCVDNLANEHVRA